MPRFTFLAAAGLLFLTLSGIGGVISDFSTDRPNFRLNCAEERGQTLAFATRPDGKNALKLTWDATKHIYGEFAYVPPVTLEKFDWAYLTVSATSGGNCPIRIFNLRLIDSTGEVFQWNGPVNWGKPGDYELKFAVTPDNASFSYGGNKDKKMDFPVKLQGFSYDFLPGSATGEVFLNQITWESSRKSELNDVTLTLNTPNENRNIVPGEASPELVFANPLKREFNCKLELTVTDFFGKSFQENTALSLPPSAQTVYRMTTPVKTAGIYWVNARLIDPATGNFAELSRSFSCMTPAGPTPGKHRGFIFGICSHPNWTSDPQIYRKEAIALSLCGAKVLRMDMEWWHTEKEQGKYDYSRYDQIVEAFAGQGVEIEGILGKPPKWACTRGNLPDYELWRKHVADMLGHFKGKIRYWEVWNEPDLTGFATFNVEEYIQLMTIARQVARETDPNIIILSGGFANLGPESHGKKDFQYNTLKGAKGLFDIHAYHEHGNFSRYESIVDGRFLPMRRELSVNVPWYANETAVSSAHIGEAAQAITLYKKLLFAKARGAIGYNWYNLRNKGVNPSDGEHNFGMITNDFYPKAVYPVFNALVQVFQGTEPLNEVKLQPNLRAYAFGGDKCYLLAAWNEDANAYQDATVAIRTKANTANRIDLFGNRTKLVKNDNLVFFPIEAVPSTLELIGDNAPQILGSLIRATAVDLAVPGKPFHLSLELTNYFDKEDEFSLSFTLPDGFSMENPVRKITLKPGEKMTETINLQIAHDTSLSFDTPEKIRLRLGNRDNTYNEVTVIPVIPAVVIPAKRGEKDWDFVIDRKQQVVSLFDADPTNVHRLWSGKDDLSARIRLERDGEMLRIIARVTDDKHVQPYTGDAVWQGDNLQLAMQLPGQKNMWEIGASLTDSGAVETFVWYAPDGFSAKDTAAMIQSSVERKGETTLYQINIPYRAIGLTAKMASEGFRFNLLVNDNDGFGRDGWMQISEGIGSVKTPEKFPFVCLP